MLVLALVNLAAVVMHHQNRTRSIVQECLQSRGHRRELTSLKFLEISCCTFQISRFRHWLRKSL